VAAKPWVVSDELWDRATVAEGGAAFPLPANGLVTVLHVFPANDAGAFPRPIVQGADGALYGTVSGGVGTLGHFPGYVYRLDPITGDFRNVHDFVISDGFDPTGPLFQGSDGFFYGTTNEGGPPRGSRPHCLTPCPPVPRARRSPSRPSGSRAHRR
jgi:hypothetical protein